METREETKIESRNRVLETFLRGMETGSTDEVRPCLHPLKPSLEGWKLSSFLGLFVVFQTLKPSLEGWKLDAMIVLGFDDARLETFLRGMETMG